MSLLVLDPAFASAGPESVGRPLTRQLADLEFSTLSSAEASHALDVVAQGNVQLLICCDAALVAQLTELRISVPLVLVVGVLPAAEELVNYIRAGVQDCWCWPMPGDQLQANVARILKRAQDHAQQINREFVGMRAELELDQRAGQYIQMGMLPPNPMGIGHFHLRHKVEPSLLLSGDFVDYFQINERYFACYIADVAGHGASSAFVTVLLKNFSRRLRREYRTSMLENPGEVLSWINTELLDQGINKHVAMFFAIVDTQDAQLRYAAAAQFPPAMLVTDGVAHSLEQVGKPLGLFPGLSYASHSIAFPEGARLVAFTDGVLDLVKAATIEDKERCLVDAIQDSGDLQQLWQCLDHTRLGPDDVSCLVVEHEG